MPVTANDPAARRVRAVRAPIPACFYWPRPSAASATAGASLWTTKKRSAARAMLVFRQRDVASQPRTIASAMYAT
jgi:hypothetical protein